MTALQQLRAKAAKFIAENPDSIQARWEETRKKVEKMTGAEKETLYSGAVSAIIEPTKSAIEFFDRFPA